VVRRLKVRRYPGWLLCGVLPFAPPFFVLLPDLVPVPILSKPDQCYRRADGYDPGCNDLTCARHEHHRSRCYRNPPTRIHMIDRVIFTIKVPVQRQRAIDIPQPLVRARPPAYCRLVVARTYVQQPRIAVIAVAPCPRKAIGVAAAAPLRYRVADRRRLAAACANFLCGVRAYTCTE
jgi:hypothetical protein